MTVSGLTVGPFEENCWLLTDPATQRAVLIDPGDEPDRVLHHVAMSGCTLDAIWLTHAHLDHVGAVAAITRVHDVPILLHPDDLPLYRTVRQQATRYGLTLEAPPEPTQPLADGDVVHCGTRAFTVWHLPGHAPGHVAFIGDGECFSGDCLFAGSIGRSDLPLSDPAALARSLARLTTLDAALTVRPGHGPITTIGRECAGNPFLLGLARPRGASATA